MYGKKEGMNKRSIVLGMVIAAVFLIAMVGSASADTPIGQCNFNANTANEYYYLTGNLNCAAGQAGVIIGADGVTIDGRGFTITGNANKANCEWCAEADPCPASGIYNAGFDNVGIMDLEIKNFCTGIALAGSGPNKIMENTIDNCEIHHNGFNTMSGGSGMVTHGVHACWLDGSASAPALTITNNEIYNNEGTGSGCGDGGNGIFIYAGSPSGKHEYCDISYNYLHHNAKAGFWTKMMLSKCTITHNKVTENGGGAGITDDVQGGIIGRCKHSSYNLIAYNNASNNGGNTDYGYGIYVGGYNNIIRDNDEGNETFGGDTCGVNDNTADGICMCRSDGADNNQILHNTICSNHRYGVHATSNTFNNSLYYNYICFNWQKDVWDESDAADPYLELFGDYNNGATAYQYCDYSAVDCPDVPFWGDCGLVGPDLTVSDKHETWVTPDVSYTITFTVTNAGNMQAGASNTRVWVNGNVQGTYPCPALNPGQSHTTTTGTINLANPPNPDTILVCADVDGIVTETNENNNCMENKFGAADLEIILPDENYVVWTDLSWKTYELRYQVKNVGARATPNDVRVNFTELWGDWKDCVNPIPIPAGLQPGETTAMLTAGPFVMGDAADWVEEWVNFGYSCPVNYWNVLHHDRTRWTEGYPIPALGGVCWDNNGVIAECGDVDLNGWVDYLDALRAFNDDYTCAWAANVDGNDWVDYLDALRIFNDDLNCRKGCV